MTEPRDSLEAVRSVCRELPGVSEAADGRPVFRIGTRSFAMYMDDHHGDGRLALWLKAAPGAQDVLIEADPERFFVPAYVGRQGWVGARLDRPPVDWPLLRSLIIEACALQAPKRLAARIAGLR